MPNYNYAISNDFSMRIVRSKSSSIYDCTFSLYQFSFCSVSLHLFSVRRKMMMPMYVREATPTFVAQRCCSQYEWRHAATSHFRTASRKFTRVICTLHPLAMLPLLHHLAKSKRCQRKRTAILFVCFVRRPRYDFFRATTTLRRFQPTVFDGENY